MRYLRWLSGAVALAIVLAGKGTAAEEKTAEDSPPKRPAIESRTKLPTTELRRIPPEQMKKLREALTRIPQADRKRLDEALGKGAPAPATAPRVAQPRVVRRLVPAPAPQPGGDADLRRTVFEQVLALTSPDGKERAEAERHILALGRLSGDTVREVFAATADRSLRGTLSSILFVMGEYGDSLPYILQRTDNEVWGRITAKIMDLDPDERLALVEALAALPDDLCSTRQFQFLSFAVGDYRSAEEDLDHFEAWFFIPCCTVGFRETLFRQRFGAEEESARAIKERLLTKELDDQIKIFYLSYLSQERPELLDAPALMSLLGGESEALREAVGKTVLETLATRLPAIVRAFFADKRYDPVVDLITGCDWKTAGEEELQACAALVREIGCDAAVWRHLGGPINSKRAGAFASSIAACAQASDSAAEVLADMADLLREETLDATAKRSILSGLAGVALAAGEDGEEEDRAAAARFLHEAFEHIESPAGLSVADERQEGWIGLIGALTEYFEADGGDRFLGWYATATSTSRTTSRLVRTTTRPGTVSRSVARTSETAAAFTEELLDKVKSENGRANIARLTLEGAGFGQAASGALVNDRRLPADIRRQLFEMGSGNTYPVLFESFASLEDLFPIVGERPAVNLVSVLWPGEQRAGEYSLSDDDRERFMRLAVKDTRSAVLEKVLGMKLLPQELCFAAAPDWLAHPDAGVRAGAIMRLGSYATREAVPLLLPLLEDRESGVRSAAVKVLGSLAAVEAEHALLALRADPSSLVRAEVDRALATIETIKSLGQADEEPAGETAPEPE